MSVRRLAAVQPDSFAFQPETLKEARRWMENYPAGKQQSAVIPVLWLVQKQDGWVSEPAIRAVAELLGMPQIRVLEVATFYTMFMLEPVGTHALVQVCGTTPCQLRGSEDLKAVCQRKFGPLPPDRRRQVLLAGSRMPGRLRQRADGRHQRLLL